ncbi:hypothetical protein Tco_1336169 [Tanacetum coccineum]
MTSRNIISRNDLMPSAETNISNSRNDTWSFSIIPNRLHNNLLINRTEYTQHIPNQTSNIQELTQKGTLRINERGFKTIGVARIGNESLYRAVSRGLMGDEDAYGMWAMDPSRVLKALTESLSIRKIVFNVKDEILIKFLPTPDAEIEFTAYVLCVPTISNVTKAYALEAALPILTPQPTNNNAPEEVLRQNRIFSVNFDLTLNIHHPMFVADLCISCKYLKPAA